MTGQVEIRLTAACLRSGEHMDAAMDRAADVIYRRHPRGGPSIAGDLSTGVISILTFVDDEDCDAWLPQLRALCLAVERQDRQHLCWSAEVSCAAATASCRSTTSGATFEALSWPALKTAPIERPGGPDGPQTTPAGTGSTLCNGSLVIRDQAWVARLPVLVNYRRVRRAKGAICGRGSRQ